MRGQREVWKLFENHPVSFFNSVATFSNSLGCKSQGNGAVGL